MSSLKAILESHPIKNLYVVIKSVKSELAPKLAFSKDKKRHSKETLIDHILKLDEMGLLKKRPAMNVKQPRAKKVKAEPKAEPKIKVDLSKVDVVKSKKEPKKAPAKAKAPKTKKQIESQIIADSLDKPSSKSLLEELDELEDFKNPTNVPKKAKALVKNQKKQKKPRAAAKKK